MNGQLELEATAEGNETLAEQDDHLGGMVGVLPSVTVGRLVLVDPEQGPMVDFAMNDRGVALPARTLVHLDPAQAGNEVTLVFEEGEITRPIILGVIQKWVVAPEVRVQAETSVQVKHEAGSLLLTAAKEITLQCGKASLTLTNAGRVLLRGTYLSSRASGVNRIKGGSVQIN